ncbi:YcaO-like family protein [Halomarina ordinaria]|uniref:YcaO-like family protein n=1 Tax=Halomarina ordinaria TaxID=3033939 RepID=A0ABD5U4Q2_9EURY|nr:YcaO-like family protein [Halomarina sp. PSRA2]
MTVELVGDGPALAALRETLADASVPVATASADALADADATDADLTVVVGPVGAQVFATANEVRRRWLAVELGGVGGRALPDVDASVSGFGPSTGCYDCLRGRVAASAERVEDGAGPDAPTARLAGTLAARSAVGLLDGDDAPLGRVLEVPHAEREFLALPHCSCAPERDWALRREGESRSLDDALARAERALDGRVGPVAEVGEAESFPLPYYLASLADTAGFSDVRAPVHAAGVDPDWDAAMMKALGEALERYGAAVYRRGDLPAAPAATLPGAVSLSRFVTPEGIVPRDDETTTWVPGEDLHSGASVALPAERVFFPYETEAPTITTGLGLGNGGAGALVAGLTEVLERDASMLAWYSTYDPLGLAIDDEGFETLVRRARAEGLSVTPTLLTQDVDVPVVACAVHREGEWPRFALGTACALDPARAARSACCEAIQNWLELRGMGRGDAANAGGRIGHFASRPDSVEGFVAPEATVPASGLAVEASTDAAALSALLDRVADAGLDAYAARLTPRDVDALGFEVVRVLLPEAQPLFVDESYFGARAESVPASLGFEARLRREHHPFP